MSRLLPSRRPARRRGGGSGQATVELALLLPVVALALLLLLELALVGRDAVLVTHAAREAARAAAVDAHPDAARRAAAASGVLDADRLQVEVLGRGGPGSRVQVRVSYRVEGRLPVMGRLVTNRTLSANVTMRVE